MKNSAYLLLYIQPIYMDHSLASFLLETLEPRPPPPPTPFIIFQKSQPTINKGARGGLQRRGFTI